MNILGVGAPEIIIITLILLIVAGPRRMARWAYVAGRYMARLREMWAEATSTLQEELEATGLKDELSEFRKAGEFNVVEEVRRAIAEPAGSPTRKHQAHQKAKKERESKSWTPGAGQGATGNDDQEPRAEGREPKTDRGLNHGRPSEEKQA
jgi:Tat protein translocase TatB subunit